MKEGLPEEAMAETRRLAAIMFESINNPGEQMRPQLSGTSYLAVFRAQVFPYPPTC